MLQKTLAAVTGLVALVTATVVAIIAAAFALYAVLVPVVGQAGAAALVAGLFALIVAVVALFVANGGGHKGGRADDRHHDHGDFSFVAGLLDMAKEKPLLSVGAAIAAGVIAIRNPALVATIVAAFLGPKQRD